MPKWVEWNGPRQTKMEKNNLYPVLVVCRSKTDIITKREHFTFLIELFTGMAISWKHYVYECVKLSELRARRISKRKGKSLSGITLARHRRSRGSRDRRETTLNAMLDAPWLREEFRVEENIANNPYHQRVDVVGLKAAPLGIGQCVASVVQIGLQLVVAIRLCKAVRCTLQHHHQQ